MKNIFNLVFALSLFFSCGSQEKALIKGDEVKENDSNSKPKLIVGIVCRPNAI